MDVDVVVVDIIVVADVVIQTFRKLILTTGTRARISLLRFYDLVHICTHLARLQLLLIVKLNPQQLLLLLLQSQKKENQQYFTRVAVILK